MRDPSDPPEGAAPPPPRRFRRVLAALAVLCALVLGARWVAARVERTARREHLAAVARAEAEPGTLVPDPTVPAGAMVVDLIRVSPDLDELHDPAMVQAGEQRGEWTREAPVMFEDMGDGRARSTPDKRRRPIWIAGPYAAEAVSFAAPVGSRGSWIAVRAIPIDPVERDDPQPGWYPEKKAEVDISVAGRLRLRWKQGRTVIAEWVLPPMPHPAFAERIQKEWKANANHMDQADKKLDHLVVRVAPHASFESIFPTVEAILTVRRNMNVGGQVRSVAAFDVSVQPAPARDR